MILVYTHRGKCQNSSILNNSVYCKYRINVKKQSYFIQFIFDKYSIYLAKKSFLFQAIQFSQTVLIQTIPFNVNMQFYLTHICDRYQVLRLLARVDMGAMAMKGCSAFPKAPVSLEPHYQIV